MKHSVSYCCKVQKELSMEVVSISSEERFRFHCFVGRFFTKRILGCDRGPGLRAQRFGHGASPGCGDHHPWRSETAAPKSITAARVDTCGCVENRAKPAFHKDKVKDALPGVRGQCMCRSQGKTRAWCLAGPPRPGLQE